MAERSAALGYLAVGKETTPGTAVTPGVFIPYYKNSMFTDISLTEIKPVFGNAFTRLESVMGQRNHKGTLEMLFEPNTAEYFAAMLLTPGSVTGSNPYTHPYTVAGNSSSFTMDISLVSQSVRFFGVQASKLGITFNKDEARITPTISALGSWFGREVASVTGSGPYTINFATTYDPNPTNGLVVGDTLQGGTTAAPQTIPSFTVATIPNGQSITTTTNVSTLVAGNWVSLAPLTPSLTLLPPFVWPNTQFCFGATAAAALSATQTRLEPGPTIEIIYNFEKDTGSPRSGGFDPASLIRTTADYTFKIKKYFDTAQELDQWQDTSKSACVLRMYQYVGANTYEFRFTMNDLRIKTLQQQTESEQVIYEEIEFLGNYSSGDGQGMDLKVINALAT